MAVGSFFKRREFVLSMDINRGSTFETPALAQIFPDPADSPLKIEAEQVGTQPNKRELIVPF
jgi:hypothetical protein